MATFTVHEPPPKGRTALEQADRILFVRDGFAWGAALFNVVWMLRHRLWLVLVLYLAAVVLLLVGLAAADVPSSYVGAAQIGLSLLLGLEGAALRRWTLRRRGWREAAVVVAPSREEAERRFFAGWSAAPASRPATPTASSSPFVDPLRRPVDPGIIGYGPPAVRS